MRVYVCYDCYHSQPNLFYHDFRDFYLDIYSCFRDYLVISLVNTIKICVQKGKQIYPAIWLILALTFAQIPADDGRAMAAAWECLKDALKANPKQSIECFLGEDGTTYAAVCLDRSTSFQVQPRAMMIKWPKPCSILAISFIIYSVLTNHQPLTR